MHSNIAAQLGGYALIAGVEKMIMYQIACM